MTEEALVVLLSEADASAPLTERLAGPGRRLARYESLADLARREPVKSIELLVVQCPRDMPKGVLLAALGQLAVEHPGVPKVVVLASAPPLAVASYLTSCGVDLVWPGSADDGLERLGALVERIHEGTRWIATH